MSTIVVVGNKKSGKTTAIEALIKGLTQKGYKVATAKHIPKPNFTIDTKTKDTWRHTKAGAHITLSVAPNELTIIKKTNTTNYTLTNILQHCQNETDIIILEGFTNLTAQNPKIPKIVAIKTSKELEQNSKRYKPIIAFVGPLKTTPKNLSIPHINVLQEPQKLVKIAENKIKSIIKKEKKPTPKIKIEIEGKPLPLNPFVQKIIRAAVLSMVSTLKNTSIKGDENITINITKPSTQKESHTSFGA
jgi:molybdopterin-guanine dinucleotide biosynthesis protein B